MTRKANYISALTPGQGVTDGLVYYLRLDEGQGSLLRERALQQHSTLSYGSWSYVPNPRLSQLGSSALAQNVFCNGGYRFGFNGMHRDDEIAGRGNALDFGARMYDSRLGRWMSVDPLATEFPNHSPFAFALNSPIFFNDPDGKKAKVTVNKNEGGGGTITVSSTIYISGLNPNQQDLIQKLNSEVKSLLKPGTYLDSEGQTWTIMYDITYKAGNIGPTSEDKNFNNQIEITNIKNNANSYEGIAKVSNRVVKDAVEGKKQALATILEETVHLLGYGDKYDTYWNPDGTFYGALAKSGYEQDIATGPARAENFEFTQGNYESLGCFLESGGGLSQSGTIRLQGKFDQNSIEKKQVTDLTDKQRDNVTQAPR